MKEHKILKKWKMEVFSKIHGDLLFCLLDDLKHIILMPSAIDQKSTQASGDTQAEYIIQQINQNTGFADKLQDFFVDVNSGYLTPCWVCDDIVVRKTPKRVEEPCSGPYCTKMKNIGEPCWWCGC